MLCRDLKRQSAAVKLARFHHRDPTSGTPLGQSENSADRTASQHSAFFAHSDNIRPDADRCSTILTSAARTPNN
jgi:hypothetical protein